MLRDRGIPIETLADWGASLDSGLVTIDDLPWSGARDSFVDVYAFSSPTLLGTFPVDSDALDAVLALTALTAGQHTLVIVGRDSGDIRAAAVAIGGLAATGSVATPVLPIGLAAVGFGALVLLASRRGRLSR